MDICDQLTLVELKEILKELNINNYDKSKLKTKHEICDYLYDMRYFNNDEIFSKSLKNPNLSIDIYYEFMNNMIYPEIIKFCKLNKKIHKYCESNKKIIELINKKYDEYVNYDTINDIFIDSINNKNIYLIKKIIKDYENVDLYDKNIKLAANLGNIDAVKFLLSIPVPPRKVFYHYLDRYIESLVFTNDVIALDTILKSIKINSKRLYKIYKYTIKTISNDATKRILNDPLFDLNLI